MDPMNIVWFALLLLFLFVEITTVALVSVWFIGGALAALVVSLLGGQLWLQIVVFFVVSGGLLFLLRPLAKKAFKPKVHTNVDAVIGSQGKVTQAIDNDNAAGQVKLGAMEWTARSSDGSQIPEGTLVLVDRVEGVKVFVSVKE